MATLATTTRNDKIFPSPHRAMPAREVFALSAGALIDPLSFDLQGQHSLFTACQLKAVKTRRLVTFEQVDGAIYFEKSFEPD